MIILFLAAGELISDPVRGEYPLFLAETEGKMLIERQILSYAGIAPTRFVFAVQEEMLERFHLADILHLIAPNCTIKEVRHETQGAACTALLAIDEIDLDGGLIITNATDLIEADLRPIIDHFRAHQADAGTIVFDSLHPRYSFVRLDDDNRVIEAVEKRPISRNAVAGFYWFAKASYFFDAAKAMILKDSQLNGQFYITPTLNELILAHKSVIAWKIRPEDYHPFKSPQHMNSFEAILEYLRVNNEA